MKIPASILALTLIIGVCLACNLSERLGDDNSVLVTELWPDVPAFPGATKNDVPLPLPMRLFFRAVMKGKMQLITFRSDKPVDEVKKFYQGDSMTAAGWRRTENSCFRDTEEMRTNGQLCMFAKGDKAKNIKEEVVGVMVHEQQGGSTIFYMRFDASQMAQR